MAFSLRSGAHSEIGLVRKNNQDSGYFSPSLLLVADGMGGAAAGDLASAIAVDNLKRVDSWLENDQMLEALSGALSKANDSIADLVAWDHRLEGMGTTVSAVMFSGEDFALAHIGDSRVYLLRDGELTRLTKDHSWVQSLIDEGKLPPAEAERHPHRSLLLRVLNGQTVHTPDLTLVEAKLGDRLLLCSDGLCGLVRDSEIATLLAEPDLNTSIKQLVRAARNRGGTDNITVVVSDVVKADDKLDSLLPLIVGAAATVQIPRIPSGFERTAPIPLRQELQPALIDLPPTEPPPTAIDPDAGEVIRYSPAPEKKRSWLPVIISVSATLLVILAAFFGTRAYLQSVFFIGPSSEYVTIFRGLPDQPLGIDLATTEETSNVRIDDLPPYYARAVRDETLRPKSLEAAQSTVQELRLKAEKCIAERAEREQEAQNPAEPSDSPSPDQSQSPSPTSTPPVEDREACS